MRKKILMKLIAFFTTFLLSQAVVGQTDFMENYDLSAGNVIIQGIALNQHDGPNISDTLGDFYIKEKYSLNWIKKNWNSQDTSEKYVHASTYRIDVVENKTTQNSFFINLPTNVLQTQDANFVFDDSLFYKCIKNYLPLVSNKYEFETIEQGRHELDSIVSNDNVISYFAQWIEFDGSFEITVPYDYVEIKKKILELKTIFNNQFDAKTFTIEYPYESSFNELIFTIKCKEEDYQNYSEKKSDWKPFSPILYTKEVE